MKKTLSTIIISAAAIIAGYYLMTIPFHLFDSLSRIQMRMLFAGEILVYFAIFSAFFIIKEAKEQNAEKNRRRKERHSKRVSQMADEFSELKIYDFNSAA